MAHDLIYHTMDEAVIVLDLKHTVLSVNRSAEVLLDSAASDLILRPLSDVLTHTTAIPLDNFWPRTFEYRLENKKICDGQSIPMMRGKTLMGRLLVLRDVTAQKQAEAALRASEQRSKALLDAVPDMMFRLGHDGTLLGYKADKNQLYGVEVKVNQPLQDSLTDELIDLMLNAIAETLNEGKAITWVFDYHLPVGGLRHYETRIAPCGDDEVILIVQDVTERKQADRAATEAKMAQAHTQALAQFIENASHEFRTPVTIIKSTAYILSKHDDPEKTARQLALIREQVARLHYHIDTMLTPLVGEVAPP